jgi:hypothetical protein
VATLLVRGPSAEYPRRSGRLSTLARKVIKRVLRHHSTYEHDVHAAVVDALRGLDKSQRDLEEKILRQDERVSQIEKQRGR